MNILCSCLLSFSYEESQLMLKKDPEEFKRKVQESLRRHVTAVNKVQVYKIFETSCYSCQQGTSVQNSWDIVLLLTKYKYTKSLRFCSCQLGTNV